MKKLFTTLFVALVLNQNIFNNTLFASTPAIERSDIILEITDLVVPDDEQEMYRFHTEQYVQNVAWPESFDKQPWIDFLQKYNEEIQKHYDERRVPKGESRYEEDCLMMPKVCMALESGLPHAFVNKTGPMLSPDPMERAQGYFLQACQTLRDSAIHKSLHCRIGAPEEWEMTWGLSVVSEEYYREVADIFFDDDPSELLIRAAKVLTVMALQNICA